MPGRIRFCFVLFCFGAYRRVLEASIYFGLRFTFGKGARGARRTPWFVPPPGTPKPGAQLARPGGVSRGRTPPKRRGPHWLRPRAPTPCPVGLRGPGRPTPSLTRVAGLARRLAGAVCAPACQLTSRPGHRPRTGRPDPLCWGLWLLLPRRLRSKHNPAERDGPVAWSGLGPTEGPAQWPPPSEPGPRDAHRRGPRRPNQGARVGTATACPPARLRGPLRVSPGPCTRDED